jgi:CoA:oxalate CoA-transferase
MPMLLDGIRVVELSQYLAGPYAGMILADLGAEVIKVAQPGLRQIGSGGLNSDDFVFMATHRNKKCITLDLKDPKGKEVFFDLAQKADVVLDNYRPGVLERLGIDYPKVNARNPRIVSCSITGFGSTGPYKDKPAFDIIVQAMSGGMSITGNPPPARSGLSIGDCVGGMWAVQGIAAALYSRQQTGTGYRLEVSLLGGQIALLHSRVPSYFYARKLTEGPDRPGPTYRVYETKDGHIIIAAVGDRFWLPVCKALDCEDLATDPMFDSVAKRVENRDELTSRIQEAMLGKTTEEWLTRFDSEDVPAGPVNTIDRAVTDPQVLHQQMVVPVDWSEGEPIWLAGNPIKVSGMDQVFKSPPTIGQHTQEILSGLLGYSAGKIAELTTGKVV